VFDVASFLRELRAEGCTLGEPFEYYSLTDSTNERAKIAARAGAPHGACFLAEAQTAGRGRQGKTWHSDREENLLFTLLLRVNVPPEQLSALTLLVGVAVRSALASATHATLCVKWPNDVVAPRSTDGAHVGRKLAGVLCETEMSQHAPPAIVVGIGINVLAREFPEEIAEHATSLLKLEQDRLRPRLEVTREVLLLRVLRELEVRLTRYEQGEQAGFIAELGKHDALLGRRVTVNGRVGVATGIDTHGQLLLRVGERVEAVRSGSVELVVASGEPPA
jgi:BirA family biotin operon repressor/biotin-[acetyl-CoA-carboxylase] ligase